MYETLRNEIISIQEMQENLYIAMYASYLTLLVLAVQFSHYILICTFVVLIPFQARIIKNKWIIAVISKYITSFLSWRVKIYIGKVLLVQRSIWINIKNIK